MTATPIDRAQKIVELPSGTLRLEITHGAGQLTDLVDFAVRQNPARGFLFVSRVLGKHIPVSPQVIAASHASLAARLPANLPPQTLFIGLAETATALGQGVFEQYRDQHARTDLHFRHTTRYHSPSRSADLEFIEPHSHARHHLLYGLAACERTRAVVLIDDEISTGTTLLNLAAALKTVLPHLERVALVSLTDWSLGRRDEIADAFAALGLLLERVSLLSGHYEFRISLDWVSNPMPNVDPNPSNTGARLPLDSPRVGGAAVDPRRFSEELERLTHNCPRCAKVLILGQGEYQYGPYMLALTLERARVDLSVRFCATTRSPIDCGGAIEHKISCIDHAGDDIPHFLYNVAPTAFDLIVVGVEGDCWPHPSLMDALGTHSEAVRLL